MRRLMGFILGFLALMLATPALAAGDKVALLIAESNYSNVPALRNPSTDAALVAGALRKAGFTSVTVVQNLTKGGLEAALQSFADKADGAEVAMVYYAGHGIEIGGQNYLVPTDARLLRDRDADFEAVPLSTVLRALDNARLKLVLLDACRENPFAVKMARTAGGRSIGRGLARVEPESGDTLIAYAAKAGAIAADGIGTNSPFATALAKRIVQPGIEIRLMFGKVRDDVLLATGRVQEPFTYGSLSGEAFYLVPGTAAPAVTASLNPVQMEALAWQGALSAGTAPALQDYLRQYPAGRFAVAARENIARLESSSKLPSPLSATQPPTVKGAYIGVKIHDLSAEASEALRIEPGKGAIVTFVDPDSPGARAGLVAGDVILRLGGEQVTKDRSLADIVSTRVAGSRVVADILRKQRPDSLVVTLAPRPDGLAASLPSAPLTAEETASLARSRAESIKPEYVQISTDQDRSILAAFGMKVLPMTDSFAEQIKSRPGRGVIVQGIVADGPADKAQILRGDVIMTLNQRPANSIADLASLIAEARTGGRSSAIVELRRNEETVYLGLKLNAP